MRCAHIVSMLLAAILFSSVCEAKPPEEKKPVVVAQQIHLPAFHTTYCSDNGCKPLRVPEGDHEKAEDLPKMTQTDHEYKLVLGKFVVVFWEEARRWGSDGPYISMEFVYLCSVKATCITLKKNGDAEMRPDEQCVDRTVCYETFVMITPK